MNTVLITIIYINKHDDSRINPGNRYKDIFRGTPRKLVSILNTEIIAIFITNCKQCMTRRHWYQNYFFYQNKMCFMLLDLDKTSQMIKNNMVILRMIADDYATCVAR